MTAGCVSAVIANYNRRLMIAGCVSAVIASYDRRLMIAGCVLAAIANYDRWFYMSMQLPLTPNISPGLFIFLQMPNPGRLFEEVLNSSGPLINLFPARQ